MRIGCLQFAPQVGDVDNNLNRADAVLNRADPMDLENLDLLVLPEMAFSGYNFKDLEHISPYLEHAGSGISSLWARTMALKYDCVVAVGYPEKMDVFRNWLVSTERYNSVIVVDADGQTVANYRKSHLYYTDDTWAMEGPGFYRGHIPDLGQTAMGICMDINPYKFEAPWHSYEFAFHILEIKANLVIVSMAWLTFEDSRDFSRMADEPDMKTLTYWIQRLEPLIRSENDEEVIVIFCNRCGVEGDVQYTGTSAVLGVSHGEVRVYGLLGRGVKELLVVETDMPAFAKLVDRPEATAEREVYAEPLASSQETKTVQKLADRLATADVSLLLEGEISPDSDDLEVWKPEFRDRLASELRDEPSLITLPFQIQPREEQSNETRLPTGAITPIIPTPTAPTPISPSLRPKLAISTEVDAYITEFFREGRIQPPRPGWGASLAMGDSFTPPRSPRSQRARSSSMSYWPPPTAIADSPQDSLCGASILESAAGRPWPEESASRTLSHTMKSPIIPAPHQTGAISSSTYPALVKSKTVPDVSRSVVRQRSDGIVGITGPISSPAAAGAQGVTLHDHPPGRPPSPKRLNAYRNSEEPAATPDSATSECNPLQTSIVIAASPSIYENTLPKADLQREARLAQYPAANVGSQAPQPPSRARGLRRSASVSTPNSRGAPSPPTRSYSRGRRPSSKEPATGWTRAGDLTRSALEELLASKADALACFLPNVEANSARLPVTAGQTSYGSRKRSHSVSPAAVGYYPARSLSQIGLRSPLTV